MDEVAGAIADPVRREILEMLRADARLSAGQIAERFAISRPAVSRHLRVLRESGLVRNEMVGRQRFYVLDTARLTPLAQWLAEFVVLDGPSALTHRLDALETEVYRTRRERRTSQPRTDQSHASGPQVDRSSTGRSRIGQSHAGGPSAGQPGGVESGTGNPRAAGAPVDRSSTGQLSTGRLSAGESSADESKENTA